MVTCRVLLGGLVGRWRSWWGAPILVAIGGLGIWVGAKGRRPQEEQDDGEKTPHHGQEHHAI